jgi:hypothetical protein
VHPHSRCIVLAKLPEGLEFVHKKASLAVVGGDLANWELLLSTSGSSV